MEQTILDQVFRVEPVMHPVRPPAVEPTDVVALTKPCEGSAIPCSMDLSAIADVLVPHVPCLPQACFGTFSFPNTLWEVLRHTQAYEWIHRSCCNDRQPNSIRIDASREITQEWNQFWGAWCRPPQHRVAAFWWCESMLTDVEYVEGWERCGVFVQRILDMAWGIHIATAATTCFERVEWVSPVHSDAPRRWIYLVAYRSKQRPCFQPLSAKIQTTQRVKTSLLLFLQEWKRVYQRTILRSNFLTPFLLHTPPDRPLPIDEHLFLKHPLAVEARQASDMAWQFAQAVHQKHHEEYIP